MINHHILNCIITFRKLNFLNFYWLNKKKNFKSIKGDTHHQINNVFLDFSPK
jgi:hypothetical protein